MRNLICLTTGHAIDRNRVWSDSYHYRTKCTRCDAPLIRKSHRWVRFDAEAHGDPVETPAPVATESAP